MGKRRELLMSEGRQNLSSGLRDRRYPWATGCLGGGRDTGARGPEERWLSQRGNNGLVENSKLNIKHGQIMEERTHLLRKLMISVSDCSSY